MNIKQLKKLDRASLIIGCASASMSGDDPETTRTEILKALQHFNIKGATIQNGGGVWMGSVESSIQLSIINNFMDGNSFNTLIESLYSYLLDQLKQEEITVIIDSILCNL